MKLIDADKLREQIEKLLQDRVIIRRERNLYLRVLDTIDAAPDLSQWTEEDEHRRSDAIYFLNDAKKHYADTSEIDATIDWLNYLHKAKDLLPIDNKELDEAAFNYLRYAGGSRYTIEDFKAGANWQARHSLTIDDLERLDTLLYAVRNNKTGAFTFSKMPDEKYKKVLKRFNEQKK